MSKHNAKHLADSGILPVFIRAAAQFFRRRQFPSKFKTHCNIVRQNITSFGFQHRWKNDAMKNDIVFPNEMNQFVPDLSSMVPNLFLRKAHSFVDEI
jgi:hypothetical protein